MVRCTIMYCTIDNISAGSLARHGFSLMAFYGSALQSALQKCKEQGCLLLHCRELLLHRFCKQLQSGPQTETRKYTHRFLYKNQVMNILFVFSTA